MSLGKWLRSIYKTRFSHPQADRDICRFVQRQPVRRIIEIGILDIDRTAQLLARAEESSAGEEVEYTGLDAFDARSKDLAPLKLIDAHRTLRGTGTAIKLVPGSCQATIAAIANAHANTDLILLAPWHTEAEIGRVWMYFPRMLHGETAIIWRGDDPDTPCNRTLTHEQIVAYSDQYAGKQPLRRAA